MNGAPTVLKDDEWATRPLVCINVKRTEDAMNCCSKCFAHEWLKNFVDKNTDESGTCDFCEAEDVALLPTGALGEAFRNLFSMYVVAETYESGEPLLDLIQWRWEVFDDDLYEDQQAALLDDIINSDWDDDDGEQMLDARGLYMPKSSQQFHSTHSDVWEQFCSDVRQNPSVPIPFDEFLAEEMGQSEEMLLTGEMFSRARPGFTQDGNQERMSWNGAGIGAPSPDMKDKVRAGRANVKGQIVLYVADQEKTAISEVRPALGSYVSVGQLSLKRDCRVLDLTRDLPNLNPFVRESLSWQVEVRVFLSRLGEEMARPLEHADDEATYIPCQRLADYLRENHYDGVRYPSALNPGGSSIVFFDPLVAEAVEAKLVKITEVNFRYELDDEPRLADSLMKLSG